eukprot:COSAG04_NODE_10496_length_772_cov_221.557207_1_plen_56_part_10
MRSPSPLPFAKILSADAQSALPLLAVETFWHNCGETLGQIPGVHEFYNTCAGIGSG